MNTPPRARAAILALSFAVVSGMWACGPDQESATSQSSTPEIQLPPLGPVTLDPPPPAPPVPTGAAVAGERTLNFAWPVPCDLVVTEERTVAAQSLLMEYRVELLPTVERDEFLVRRRDFRFLKVNGLEVTHPDLRHQLVSLEIENGVMPDIRIDSKGELLGVEGWDTYSERMNALLNRLINEGLMHQPAYEEIRRQLNQPEVQEGVRMAGANFWVLWINGWLGLDFTQSAEVTVNGDFPLADGTMLTFPQRIRHHGPEPSNPGHVYVSMESHLSGDEVQESIILRSGLDRIPAFSRADVTRAEVVNTATIVLRPETMQPLEIWSENHVIVQTPPLDRANAELRRYRFEWK